MTGGRGAVVTGCRGAVVTGGRGVVVTGGMGAVVTGGRGACGTCQNELIWLLRGRFFYPEFFSLSPTNRSGERQDVHSSEATSLCFLSV